MKIRTIDLFCCAGGSSWGAKAAGVEIAAGFDQWELAGKVFKHNFPEATFYPGKLETLDAASLSAELGKIDLILASPECTNHSPAKGKADRCEISKATAFQVTRFAEVFKPRWIIVENVVSMKNWTRYKEFIDSLEGLGYNVTTQSLVATHFGVPQSRRRLFILCDRDKKPSHTPKVQQSIPLRARDLINLNGAYKWSPLAIPKRAEATLKRAERARAVLKRNPFLLVYYGTDHAGGWQRISAPLRTVTTLDRFAVVKREAGVDVMRMLQLPELQQAMGMAGMCFEHGTRRDRIRMMGNAVCPPVMRCVVEHLTKGL